MSELADTAESHPDKDEDKHWTDRVYRDNAQLLYDVEAAIFQNEQLTREELGAAQTLAEQLGAALKSPVLDIACGPGRHSIELARRGLEVTGLDFSAGLLDLARSSSREQGLDGAGPIFEFGDMRRLSFEDDSFDTVLILGNSFGYFSDEENLTALRESLRVLKPGGFFCLEITNKQHYLESFEAEEEEIVEGRFHDRLRCEWRKAWNPESRRVTTWERHSLADTGKLLYEGPYDVRLYDEQEIREILEALGLMDVKMLALTPGKDGLANGLGETFGAMGEILFIGGIRKP
jgi:D-alanine-D-alanine ligase